MLPSTNFKQKPKINVQFVYFVEQQISLISFKKEGKELPGLTAKSASKFYVPFIPSIVIYAIKLKVSFQN